MKKEGRVFYSIDEFLKDCKDLAVLVGEKDHGYQAIYGVPKGGVPVAMKLAELCGLKLLEKLPPDPAQVLVVDDLVDTGRTLRPIIEEGYDTAVLHCKAWAADCFPTYAAHRNCRDWIVYWWEGSTEKSIEDAVVRQLQFIGEDPTREGLQETPTRTVRAWGELFAGYKQNPSSIIKVFEEGACDEMVLLKDIEFYSTCEHHMLPFFGKAHIAYIPNGKVIGISKLARLLEVFARRLQIQERLGQQITSTLDELLQPRGSACVLQAQHFCMTSRGVQKQNSIMVTSSLTGVFRENAAARAEFMGLIR